MENDGIFVVLLNFCWHQQLLLVSSQNKLILKSAKLQCHSEFGSEVTGRVFLTPSFKYTNQNRVSILYRKLTSVSRNEADFFCIGIKTDKLTENCKKSLCCCFVKVYSHNGCTILFFGMIFRLVRHKSMGFLFFFISFWETTS